MARVWARCTMNPHSHTASRWPRILGALGCFAVAFAGLSAMRSGASVPDIPAWGSIALSALIAIGIGAAARTTQSTAAWIGLTAYLGYKFLFALDQTFGFGPTLRSLLESGRSQGPQMLVFAYGALGCLHSAALLVWSVRSLWRGSAVVARVLSLALLILLVAQVGFWIMPLDHDVPLVVIGVLQLAAAVQWVALGVVLLCLERHAATTPRSYAGMPRHLPSILVGVWVVFLAVEYWVAWEPLGTLRDGGQTPIPRAAIVEGILIALQCSLVAAVLWIVRVTGPGPITTTTQTPTARTIV